MQKVNESNFFGNFVGPKANTKLNGLMLKQMCGFTCSLKYDYVHFFI